MNMKTKVGLSILTLAFGVSAVLTGCAPQVTKTNTSSMPQASKPAPAVTQNQAANEVPSYYKEYPWLQNYVIESNDNNIHFAFDKSILTGADKATLKKDAIYMKYNQDVNVQVQGNCDRRGSEAYNLALGWRRANAAKAYLEDLGVNAKRVSTISYGKEKPLCKAHTEACYAINRNDHFAKK